MDPPRLLIRCAPARPEDREDIERWRFRCAWLGRRAGPDLPLRTAARRFGSGRQGRSVDRRVRSRRRNGPAGHDPGPSSRHAATRPGSRRLRTGRRLSPDLRLDQAALDRITSELDSISHPELLEDVRAVAIDRLLADHKDLGDFLAGQAFRDLLGHLELAWG
jgi:hypothetical protein